MKRTVYGLVISMILFWLSGVGFADGIPGATDKVTGATLLVPFFEAGVDVATHSQDTLLVVWAGYSGAKIHYHVWDIDGNAVGLYGNMDLGSMDSWNTSMRGLISSASTSVKDALKDSTGNYYRGFVTIDVVTADTTLNPRETGYPLGTGNYLEGWIYYVRIAEGSSNGLAMIPIEEVGTGVASLLHGFYRGTDGREEIDADARNCAALLARGESCAGVDDIYEINSRVFLDPTFNASTRIILFLWKPGTTEGISPWCDVEGCDATYTYNRYNESGVQVEDTTVRLDHVVNVIDVSGTANGFVSIWDIPAGESNWQAYAFSITSASPASGPSASWDAILESYIDVTRP